MRVVRVKVQEEPKKAKGGAIEGKPLIHIIIILDRSGSMDDGRRSKDGSKYRNAVDGINQELKALREDNTADYLITIIEFDTSNGTSIETAYDKIKLDKILSFKGTSPRGGTPLYETVGVTLEKYMKYVGKEKTLVKVFTDGGENYSQMPWSGNNGANLLKSTIATAEAKGFTVTFVGTDLDVKNMVAQAGFRQGNTMSYDGTSRGMKMSMRAATADTVAYSAKVARGEDVKDNFYSKSTVEEKQ